MIRVQLLEAHVVDDEPVRLEVMAWARWLLPTSGGLLLRDCVALLREWFTAPVLDLRDFIDGQIFNVLIGNADAHGKNYSMLYQGGQRRLAPFYDLVCTLAWPELSKTPAMKRGGAFPGRVDRRALAEDGEGSAVGLAHDPRTHGGSLRKGH